MGLLEVVPQCMQWRPPAFFGRSDLETLLARYLPSVLLSQISSHAFCLPIEVLITCLLSSAFCLAISLLITCRLSNILCKLHLLLPRVMSRVCQRYTSTFHLPIFTVNTQSPTRCARQRGRLFGVWSHRAQLSCSDIAADCVRCLVSQSPCVLQR